MKLEELDPNFRTVKTDDNGFVFHEIRSGKFQIEGFPFLEENKGSFFRLPLSKKTLFTDDLNYRAAFTAGNCVRFTTNADQIILRGETQFSDDYEQKATMTRRGMNGFDVYAGSGKYKRFYGCVVSEKDGEAEFDGVVCLDNPAHIEREVTIYLPVYNGVKSFSIGMKPEFCIKEPPKRMLEKPILFYGSSITHGESASRPGNSYVNMAARKLDAAVINMGFSANAKGEKEMAEILSDVEMSLFVMDYDYNCESREHLAQTHYPFYEIVRQKNPDLPVLMLSRPTFKTEEADKNVEIIRASYDKARENGDSNVYFMDGHHFFPEAERDECTADTVHPNDLGFYYMAEKIAEKIARIFQMEML